MHTLLSNLKKLQPIETGLPQNDSPLEGVKALLFDIYGTLIISASGDIGCVEFKGEVAWKTLEKEGFSTAPGYNTQEIGLETLDTFKSVVRSMHEKEKQQGNMYPEVVITEVWERVVQSLLKKGMIIAPDAPIDYAEIAFVFECLTNPVYPMPAMKEVLKKIEEIMPMGIVSNAQFFTPILVNYFLGVPDFAQRTEIEGFNPDFSSYSYRKKIAKPGTAIFEEVIPSLHRAGIENNQVLFVGNDMLNDIYPAQTIGFKTVLFAGDKRSLRLRENDPRVQNIKPDRVITHLEQLLTIIGDK